MRVLKVGLGNNSYEILVDSGILPDLGNSCAAIGLTGGAAVISNPLVNELYGQTVHKSLVMAGFETVSILVPDGEEFKNAETLNSIYDQLIEAGIDRSSFIVALGGGVVGDMAGFAAASYLRGIPFVQVPTTLLAQVDSSVGGKTGIDHPKGKNLIGAFYQPRLVVADVHTLTTLSDREYRAGLAEVIKYGVVLDATLFAFLEQHVDAVAKRDAGCLAEVVRRCCAIKAGVVEQDERESGLRAVLNYGHTLGHAFETSAGYGVLIHGEAVAIGMVLAARISEKLGFSAPVDTQRIEALIDAYGLPSQAPRVRREQLLDALANDKKSKGKMISYVCNRGIGAHAFHRVSADDLFVLNGLED